MYLVGLLVLLLIDVIERVNAQKSVNFSVVCHFHSIEPCLCVMPMWSRKSISCGVLMSECVLCCAYMLLF